jgi:hypothetical protein
MCVHAVDPKPKMEEQKGGKTKAKPINTPPTLSTLVPPYSLEKRAREREREG